jgi:hypothetical protein
LFAALYNEQKEMQYVGYARNMVQAVRVSSSIEDKPSLSLPASAVCTYQSWATSQLSAPDMLSAARAPSVLVYSFLLMKLNSPLLAPTCITSSGLCTIDAQAAHPFRLELAISHWKP